MWLLIVGEKFDIGREAPARFKEKQTVAPLQNSARAERACSIVAFLRQETPS